MVSENSAVGMKEPALSDGWVTVEADSWHFHMNTESVVGVQFVEAEDHGVPFLYYVRFSDTGEATLLRVYFPNPYLDDDDNPTEFQPEKLRFFEDFRDRYVGQEGIVFVRRERQPLRLMFRHRARPRASTTGRDRGHPRCRWEEQGSCSIRNAGQVLG